MGAKVDIGTRIRTMRMSRKMTQADLAKAIDQSPSSITMYETGRREPEFEILEAMADVFNVPLVAFIADDFSEDEIHLVTAYRGAEAPIQRAALKMLEDSAEENRQKKGDSASGQTA